MNNALETCPTQGVLERLARGRLAEEDAVIVEAHLDACADCARRFSELTDLDEFVQNVRDAEEWRRQSAATLDRLARLGQRVATRLCDQAERLRGPAGA